MPRSSTKPQPMPTDAGHTGYRPAAPGDWTDPDPQTVQEGLDLLSDPDGAGHVVGPASATDNALARFNGVTGKLIQNSNITLTGSTFGSTGNVTFDLASGGVDTTFFFTNSTGRTASLDVEANITAGGWISASTNIYVANLELAGNTLSSTDTNGDIYVKPHGTGITDIGNDGDIELCAGNERTMYPQTDLKVNLGKSTNRFKDIHMGGSLRQPIATIAGSDTLTTAHAVVLANAVGGAMTLTLPAAAGSSGQRYSIKKIDASANAVTIDGNGAETIDDSTTVILSSQYDSITIVCDGTEWWII